MDLFHLGGIIKLSIFPLAKALPKSKDEKNEQSKFASRPYLPEVREVQTDDDLINLVTTYVWSPVVFREARLKADFVSTDFLVLDIDSGLTIEEAEKRVEESGLTCLCVPSTSHTPEAHRFRLIFPLAQTITNIEDFEASMEDLIVNGFPECDLIVAHNPCAFFFASTMNDGFWIEGQLLEPIKAKKEPIKGTFSRPNTESKIKVTEDVKELINELYGEDRDYIPECVDHFLRNAGSGLPGTWVCDLNSFCYTLSLQNIEEYVIFDIVEFLAPDILDKRDIDCIKRACRDGKRDRSK